MRTTLTSFLLSLGHRTDFSVSICQHLGPEFKSLKPWLQKRKLVIRLYIYSL